MGRRLTQEAVVKNFFTTAADGKSYSTKFYNLDAIISVGYRVKSHVATLKPVLTVRITVTRANARSE